MSSEARPSRISNRCAAAQVCTCSKSPLTYRMSSACRMVSGSANFCVMVFRKRCCDASPLRTSRIFSPYLRRMSSSMMVLPFSADCAGTLNRKRLSESPYSCTNSLSYFPECLPMRLSVARLDKNILLSGSRTMVPVTTQISPTGRNEKNERLG